MKTKTVSFLFALFFLSVQTSAQHLWSFDGDDILKTSSLSFKTNWHSVREHPEMTDGITGRGLRTDGYSAWMDIQCIQPMKVEAISAWFALESYPTDTAAFFGVRNVDDQSVTLCVDRFGCMLVGFHANG
ncbi:MAG: glycoside hydrolase family 32 protein, partial [Tannerellaceae bacterium]|nr:glycoside hydrolase family 32 protein [Tannerellaceae bacterium]